MTATTPLAGGFNLAIDQRPAAVAYPADADEVADVIRAARAAGLRVAAQATGHNAGPLGDRSRTRCSSRRPASGGVEIDAERRIARVGAGVLWEDVVDAAAPHGLTALHGSSPDVGVAGYSLGGGMGWLARSHGLQTNSVTAIELVTADGEFRPRRRRQRPGAVLGAARRRRQLRHRHRARVPALPELTRDLRRA